MLKGHLFYLTFYFYSCTRKKFFRLETTFNFEYWSCIYINTTLKKNNGNILFIYKSSSNVRDGHMKQYLNKFLSFFVTNHFLQLPWTAIDFYQLLNVVISEKQGSVHQDCYLLREKGKGKRDTLKPIDPLSSTKVFNPVLWMSEG